MKKSLVLSILISVLSTSAYAERVKLLDPLMATINPQATLTGPVFKNDNSLKTAYGTEMARIILKEADSYGKRYLEYGDTKAYYTLMVLAMTVPMHEGLYVHFRDTENDKDVCRDKLNTGKNIASKEAKKNFQKAFNSGATPFLVECKEVKRDDRIRQLIAGGGDGSDIGVMQLSSRWHYDEFLGKQKFASVKETVNYGLSHLMKGFRPIYANFEKYECLKNTDGTINRDAVIRGAWSGIYNSGNLGKTCRFADPNDPHAKKDIGFLSNLNKTFGLQNNGPFGYGGDLELGLDALTKAALQEIVNNYKNGTNQRDSLDKVLAL